MSLRKQGLLDYKDWRSAGAFPTFPKQEEEGRGAQMGSILMQETVGARGPCARLWKQNPSQAQLTRPQGAKGSEGTLTSGALWAETSKLRFQANG